MPQSRSSRLVSSRLVGCVCVCLNRPMLPMNSETAGDLLRVRNRPGLCAVYCVPIILFGKKRCGAVASLLQQLELMMTMMMKSRQDARLQNAIHAHRRNVHFEM